MNERERESEKTNQPSLNSTLHGYATRKVTKRRCLHTPPPFAKSRPRRFWRVATNQSGNASSKYLYRDQGEPGVVAQTPTVQALHQSGGLQVSGKCRNFPVAAVPHGRRCQCCQEHPRHAFSSLLLKVSTLSIALLSIAALEIRINLVCEKASSFSPEPDSLRARKYRRWPKALSMRSCLSPWVKAAHMSGGPFPWLD